VNRTPRKKWLAMIIMASALLMALHNTEYGPAAMEVIAAVAISMIL